MGPSFLWHIFNCFQHFSGAGFLVQGFLVMETHRMTSPNDEAAGRACSSPLPSVWVCYIHRHSTLAPFRSLNSSVYTHRLSIHVVMQLSAYPTNSHHADRPYFAYRHAPILAPPRPCRVSLHLHAGPRIVVFSEGQENEHEVNAAL